MHDETEVRAGPALVAALVVAAASRAEARRPGEREHVEVEIAGRSAAAFARLRQHRRPRAQNQETRQEGCSEAPAQGQAKIKAMLSRQAVFPRVSACGQVRPSSKSNVLN